MNNQSSSQVIIIQVKATFVIQTTEKSLTHIALFGDQGSRQLEICNL